MRGQAFGKNLHFSASWSSWWRDFEPRKLTAVVCSLEKKKKKGIRAQLSPGRCVKGGCLPGGTSQTCVCSSAQATSLWLEHYLQNKSGNEHLFWFIFIAPALVSGQHVLLGCCSADQGRMERFRHQPRVICWHTCVPSSHPGEFSKVTELIKRLIHYIASVTTSWVWA